MPTARSSRANPWPLTAPALRSGARPAACDAYCGIASAANPNGAVQSPLRALLVRAQTQQRVPEPAAVLKKPAHIGPIEWASVGALFSTRADIAAYALCPGRMRAWCGFRRLAECAAPDL